MDIVQFKESIKQLFGNELLDEFYDDYGFTYETEKSITRVGYSTNLSLEVIEKAAKDQVDLLITHHDAWGFIYGLREECVEKLKKYNMSHFWIHGPLDYIEFGTSTSLMNVIGIDRVIKHSTYDNGDIPGIGEFHNPVSCDALVTKMRSVLNEPVRAWKNHDKEIKRIGVITGAGHSSDNIRKAFEDGCDTYITGEATLYSIQYAQFVGINLLVGSHTYTEIYGVESLVKKIKEMYEDLTILRIEEEHFELNHS